MKMTIITWSSVDNSIAILLTWTQIYEFAPYGSINWAMPGQQVSAYHFPLLARPIGAEYKQWAIDQVRASGFPLVIDDQTAR